MRRLISIVQARRLPFSELVTHRFRLDQIGDAYELFRSQRDGVLKVAIAPS
jgi:alcohol dehydrogenase